MIGTCKLCGQEMGLVDGDAWHPYYVETACPPVSQPYGLPIWGTPGRPGVEYFVADES